MPNSCFNPVVKGNWNLSLSHTKNTAREREEDTHMDYIFALSAAMDTCKHTPVLTHTVLHETYTLTT
jgi:hypothetical protein